MLQQQSPKIADAYKVYRLDAQARRVTPATLGTYTDRIEPFIKWCEKNDSTRLGDVTATLLRSYLVSLQGRNLSSYTINGIARALKAFFNFCVADGLIPDTPMRRVAIPKIDKKILPALSVDDAQKLLAACESERDEALLLFLLDTGVRAHELLGLNGGDIDTEGGNVIVRQGKGRKDRQVYIGAKARKALLRYYLERGQPGGNDAIWISSRGGERLTDSGLRQLLERLGNRAGVAHCSPHTFRRTFALWSLRNGMSIYHLQRLMGHADIAILRQYLALVESDARAAHEQHGAVDNML